MARLLPDVSPAQWPTLHAQRGAPWDGALAALGAAWGRPGGWARMEGGEDSAVFAQDDVVVKLVPPFAHRDAEREASVLGRLALPTPTPRLLDVRSLDAWTAVLLSRLPGTPAARVWADVPQADRRDVSRTLGETLRALWATPLRPEDGEAAALDSDLVSRARRHVEDGLADPAAFLRERLPTGRPEPALVHLDLTAENVLLDRHRGRWRVAGVLDFVASRASYPAIDLVTPGVFFCRGDPALLGALVEGSGLATIDARELAGWHVLHPFSSLSRDLAWAGLGGAPSLESALDRLWAWR